MTFDVLVDAHTFNNVVPRLRDSHSYEVSACDGLLLARMGRRIRLPEILPEAYPPGPQLDETGGLGESGNTWSIPAAQLAGAFEFIIPFISAADPDGPRSVATWTGRGELVGGTPMKAGLVKGLPVPDVPISFRRPAAMAVAAFLAGLVGDVRVGVVGGHSIFSCPAHGHQLIVPVETAELPDHLTRFPDHACERFTVDRKAIHSGVDMLKYHASARCSSPRYPPEGRGPGMPRSGYPRRRPRSSRSSDEFAIIRNTTAGDGAVPGRHWTAATSVPDSCFSVPGDILCKVLGAWEVVTLNCRYDGPGRRLSIEAASEGTGSCTVFLRVGTWIPENG